MHRKKVVGMILLLTGITVIALGLVIGFVAPNMVLKKVEESICVNSKDSPGYKRLGNPSHFLTKVYYWNITNKMGFFYRGEKPQLSEKGPYVYSMTSKEIDVKFGKGTITSKSLQRAKFNRTLTEKECPTCRESDELTILNVGYLGIMQRVGSAWEFSFAFIPMIMNILFLKLSATTKLNKTSILLEMGKTHNQLPLNSSCYPAFGSWLNSVPKFFPLRKNYTLKEMNGLYGALMDPSKFGPFDHPKLLKRCRSGNITEDCGLALNLLALQKGEGEKLAAIRSVRKILCPNKITSCFPVPCIFCPSFLIILRAVGEFIIELSKYVLWYLDDNNYGLTTTRSQDELSHGYVIKLPLPGHPLGIHVPGPINLDTSEKEVIKAGGNSTLYTCESDEPFSYAAINGKSRVNKDFYPNASSDQLRVRGYGYQYPGVKHLKACSAIYTPAAKKYELFVSTFRMAVPITYKRDVKIDDIPMHRYVISESAVEVNNMTVFTKGVFDVSRVLKAPIYASLPGFLYGEDSLYGDLGLPVPNEQKYGSSLSIEPISGTAMQLKIRYQLNGKIIANSSLSPYYPETKNVSYEDKMIPILWTEKEASIDAMTSKEFRSKVLGSLQLFCGFFVALPVIGGIFVIIGVVFIVLAVKKTKYERLV